ncbi:hypothetical protein PRIC1_004997 [Phytophthora ramorum]
MDAPKQKRARSDASPVEKMAPSPRDAEMELLRALEEEVAKEEERNKKGRPSSAATAAGVENGRDGVYDLDLEEEEEEMVLDELRTGCRRRSILIA